MRWLKTKIYNEDNSFFQVLKKGIGEGLIFQSLVRNVIFSKLFDNRNLNSLNSFYLASFFKFHLDSSSPYLPSLYKRNSLQHSLVIYKNDVSFITSDRRNTFNILSVVKNFFI